MWRRGWGSVNKASTHTHKHTFTQRHTLTQRQHTKWACQAVQPVRQTQLRLRPKLANAGATPPSNVFQQRAALPSPYCLSPLPLSTYCLSPQPPHTPLHCQPTRLCSAFSRVFWHAQSAKHKQKPNLPVSVCKCVCLSVCVSEVCVVCVWESVSSGQRVPQYAGRVIKYKILFPLLRS